MSENESIERACATTARTCATSAGRGIGRTRTETFASAATIVSIATATTAEAIPIESVISSIIPSVVTIPVVVAIAITIAVAVAAPIVSPVVVRASASATAAAPGTTTLGDSLRHLHLDGGAVNARAVETTNRILGIAIVLEVNEAESGGISCHPHVTDISETTKWFLEVSLGRARPQVANVDLGIGFADVV